MPSVRVPFYECVANVSDAFRATMSVKWRVIALLVKFTAACKKAPVNFHTISLVVLIVWADLKLIVNGISRVIHSGEHLRSRQFCRTQG